MYITWDAAREILNNNGVIAFPTDTVYGLACAASSKEAIAKVYALKGRSFNKPLVLMCADVPAVKKLTSPWSDAVSTAVARYWPGALTLVMQRDAQTVPDMIVAGGPNVGVRIPNNIELVSLLAALPFPLAVTSANRSGEKELMTAQDVERIFGDTIDGIVNDDSALQGGMPSTVVDVSVVPWKVLRQGPVIIEGNDHG